ncbi:MAG: hypothetical protein KDD62_15695, partial [Bdellovibrionales bacterium]|nr:hypothetical protein [Bdellovibrionales bacterium]
IVYVQRLGLAATNASTAGAHLQNWEKQLCFRTEEIIKAYLTILENAAHEELAKQLSSPTAIRQRDLNSIALAHGHWLKTLKYINKKDTTPSLKVIPSPLSPNSKNLDWKSFFVLNSSCLHDSTKLADIMSFIDNAIDGNAFSQSELLEGLYHSLADSKTARAQLYPETSEEGPGFSLEIDDVLEHLSQGTSSESKRPPLSTLLSENPLVKSICSMEGCDYELVLKIIDAGVDLHQTNLTNQALSGRAKKTAVKFLRDALATLSKPMAAYSTQKFAFPLENWAQVEKFIDSVKASQLRALETGLFMQIKLLQYTCKQDPSRRLARTLLTSFPNLSPSNLQESEEYQEADKNDMMPAFNSQYISNNEFLRELLCSKLRSNYQRGTLHEQLQDWCLLNKNAPSSVGAQLGRLSKLLDR